MDGAYNRSVASLVDIKGHNTKGGKLAAAVITKLWRQLFTLKADNIAKYTDLASTNLLYVCKLNISADRK